MAKLIIGTVTSDKPLKTIVVSVQTRKTHPIYKKQYTQSHKFLVHDPKDEAKVGDRVAIVETRPISARKYHKLHEIINVAAIRHVEKETPS
jgi:small subunit ribosomal protein S17